MEEQSEIKQEDKGNINNVRRALNEFIAANPDGCIFSLALSKAKPDDDNSGTFICGKPKDILLMLALAIHSEPKIAEIVRTAVKLVDEFDAQNGKEKENQSLN